MSRYFNEQEVELLAPAGNFEIFQKVIKSGADAVYFGGKIFNMRMHRKDFNFTNEEVAEAIKLAHSLGKKVYITVNNLLSSEDLENAEEYFRFLEKVGPDAIIVQDMSVVKIIRELGLNINIHSSVMMNVHNLETIRALEELGVTRVVTSREMDLNTIKQLSCQTDMEFEYFVHGDMCVAHGSQCLYSGMLFGNSGSRGRCMKPCRWGFELKKDEEVINRTFPLAVKDMYMYEHIPELIEAGVVSFKIEGRMRDAEYLVELINYYSDAIDRYIADPISFDRKKNANDIYENRKRDLSTGYAFGKPGLDNINERYEGTGKFYSTGKVFSNPIEEQEVSAKRANELKEMFKVDEAKNKTPKLTVKVNSYDAAIIAIEAGVDAVYLSGEVFEPKRPFTKEEIKMITSNKKNIKIYLSMPRMMSERDFSKYNQLLRNNDLGLDGLGVTNLGAIRNFKDLGLELVGEYSLNIYNALSADFYNKQGLSRGVLSPESRTENTKDALLASEMNLEMIVHGSPVVMYLEHDLYENLSDENRSVNSDVLKLVDDEGREHPIYRDNEGRNHMLLSKELCYLPILKELNELGCNYFRIEGCHYSNESLKVVLDVYKKAVQDLDKCNEVYEGLKYESNGFTLGALQFD